jgi:hypothetical protein
MEKKYPSKLSKQDVINQLIKNSALLQEKSIQLLTSMNNLTKKMENLIAIFEKAADYIEKEEVTEPLSEKLSQLLDQNRKIAQGLLVLEKFVREKGFLPMKGNKEFEI